MSSAAGPQGIAETGWLACRNCSVVVVVVVVVVAVFIRDCYVYVTLMLGWATAYDK